MKQAAGDVSVRAILVLALFVMVAASGCLERPLSQSNTSDDLGPAGGGGDEAGGEDAGSNDNATPPPENATYAFEEIEGCTARGSSEEYTIVRDEATWRAWWEKYCQEGVIPPPDVPEVDFSNGSVILASWGKKANSGFAIEIKNVTNKEGAAVVEVTRYTAGPSCATAQVITYPVALARTDLRADATFEFTEEILDCA